ncbi:MAG: glycine cleavage system protein GcvH [Parachlamydiaceae bacterium]|nr:glycine cleavage system protein GcvH [Parachlamydiaceae bacterium]
MKFTESHEWIEVQNGLGIVGISNHAQNELGDIVYIELPQIGKMVKAGEEAAVLESTKAAADVYSPVSGIIEEVNHKLSETPELVNSSPQQEGWIFKIKIQSPEELDKLMDSEKYLSQFKG